MKNSKIKWTKHTQNWWTGCTHATYLDGVTPREACLKCYAEAWSKQTGGQTRPRLCEWGDDKPRHRTSEQYWNNPRKWNVEQVREGQRANVFVDSLSDICDRADARLDDWRREAFEIMDECPMLNWLLLTSGVPPSVVTCSAPTGRTLVSTIPPPLRVGAERQVSKK